MRTLGWYWSHTYSVPGIGTAARSTGMLLILLIPGKRPRFTWNTAFIAGSSKQGKARRASVASNCVVAIYLVSPEGPV